MHKQAEPIKAAEHSNK